MKRNSKDIYVQPVLVPHDDPILVEHYADIIAVFPQAQIIEDENGTYRFRTNRLMEFFSDAGRGEMISPYPNYKQVGAKYEGAPTLNDVAEEYHKGTFSMEEYLLFYQDIGYSLSGYLDVFSEEVGRMHEEGWQLLPGPVLRKISTGNIVEHHQV